MSDLIKEFLQKLGDWIWTNRSPRVLWTVLLLTISSVSVFLGSIGGEQQSLMWKIWVFWILLPAICIMFEIVVLLKTAAKPKD
jgi:hypothetical protein